MGHPTLSQQRADSQCGGAGIFFQQWFWSACHHHHRMMWVPAVTAKMALQAAAFCPH